jgi:hypothetical protein
VGKIVTGIDLSEKRHSLLVIIFIYLSIFINSYVFFTQPFEFQFGYIIFIILLPGYMARYGINRNLFFIFLVLLCSGLFNILLGNNTSTLFFKVYTGLILSYFFYYYVVLDFDFNIDRLFRWYLKGSLVVTLLGLFQFISFQVGFVPGYTFWNIFNKWGFAPGGIFGIRVNSVFSEPTHLACVLSAAFFVAVYNIIRKKTYGLTRIQSLLVIAVYLLSFSGLGQAGIFLTLVFLAISYGLFRYVIIVVPAVVIIFNLLYNNVEEFRDRYDSLTGLYSGEEFKLGKTHGSSFILYNNYRVAMENFKTNFVFGTGIGSHPVAFEKHSMAKHIKTYGFNLNSADANSMFLRLVSETGLFGISIFLILVLKCYVKRNVHYESYHWLVSNSILVMILLNMFRQGHYFLNGFPFFVILYYYNYVSYQDFLSESVSNMSPADPEQADQPVTVKLE